MGIRRKQKNALFFKSERLCGIGFCQRSLFFWWQDLLGKVRFAYFGLRFGVIFIAFFASFFLFFYILHRLRFCIFQLFFQSLIINFILKKKKYIYIYFTQNKQKFLAIIKLHLQCSCKRLFFIRSYVFNKLLLSSGCI